MIKWILAVLLLASLALNGKYAWDAALLDEARMRVIVYNTGDVRVQIPYLEVDKTFPKACMVVMRKNRAF